MRYYPLLIVTLLTTCFLCGDEETPYMKVALRRFDKRGFFSVMEHVSRCVFSYETDNKTQDTYKGLEVDFGTRGLYYDQNFGPNWWNYYFEPLQLGDTQGQAEEVVKIEPKDVSFLSELRKEPLQNVRTVYNNFIQNHVRLKPVVMKKVATLKKKLAPKMPTIGVHYRGTDKLIKEAKRVPYETVVNEVREVILKNRYYQFQLFIATDEQEFLEYIKGELPGRIVYQEYALRSSDGRPVHQRKEEQYLRGLEALIDCILLSECDYLVRTPSGLSQWALFFNPDLPFTLLK